MCFSLHSILLVGVAILSLYSVHLLLMTAKEGGSLIYEKLGERAFGWPGKIAAFTAIIMQNIGGKQQNEAHLCLVQWWKKYSVVK